MFRKGIVVVLLFAVFSPGVLSALDRKAVDKLILKMEKAVDPKGKSKTIKTQLTKARISIPAQQMKMDLILTDKFPNKSRMVTVIPSIMKLVRVFNGKQGWEYSKSTGLREITGKELNFLKFETRLKDSSMVWRELFPDITVPDKLVKVGDFECYQITCTPKKDFDLKPMVLYVDNKKYFVRKATMTVETQMGPIQAVSIMKKYKDMDGLFIATEQTIIQMGMQMDYTILEVKNNVDVKDTDFDKPVMEK